MERFHELNWRSINLRQLTTPGHLIQFLRLRILRYPPTDTRLPRPGGLGLLFDNRLRFRLAVRIGLGLLTA